MDADIFYKSQLKTLKDLGKYDGPIDSEEEEGEYLCTTQESSQTQQRSSLHDSSEYICDLQDNSPRHSPDSHSANACKYCSPPHSPVSDDRFYHQMGDDDDGYISPAASSRSRNLFRSPNHSDVSDEGSPTLQIRRLKIGSAKQHKSPNASPLILRKKASGAAAYDSDDDIYGPGDPTFDIQSVHRKIGMEPFKIGSNNLPVNWTDATLSCSHYTVEINAGNSEFDQIHSTITKVDIPVEKIERIENKLLLDKFVLECKQMETRRKCTNKDLNIAYLFHGTSAEKKDLAEEGLDQRLSRTGHFGKGIYFSDDPRKCMEYVARRLKRGETGCILMCRVLLGDVKVYRDGDQDSTLKREPKKVDNIRYDSVKGRVSRYVEYVTYQSSRALLEYIVTVGLPKEKQKKPRPIPRRRTVSPSTSSSVSSSDNPNNEEKAVEQFMDITGSEDLGQALDLLHECNSDVNKAVNMYYQLQTS